MFDSDSNFVLKTSQDEDCSVNANFPAGAEQEGEGDMSVGLSHLLSRPFQPLGECVNAEDGGRRWSQVEGCQIVRREGHFEHSSWTRVPIAYGRNRADDSIIAVLYLLAD